MNFTICNDIIDFFQDIIYLFNKSVFTIKRYLQKDAIKF